MELENKNHHYVPEEIMREILLRVPVKSLLRFRCVSKPWRSLISSYKFAKAHLKLSATTNINHNNNNNKLMYGFKTPHRTRYYLDPSYRTLPRGLYSSSVESIFFEEGLSGYNLLSGRLHDDDCPFDDGTAITLVGSCNGLFCVEFSHTIVLWNPTTKEWKMLPKSSYLEFAEIDDDSDDDEPFYLVNFDKAFSFGFGYDELHDNYKVVVVKFLRGKQEVIIKVYVYSLRTNSWKTMTLSSSSWHGKTISRFPGQFVNGSIHWLLLSNYLDAAKGGQKVIVSHDLATDTFAQTMPLALPVVDHDYEKAELGIVGGCLAVYFCKRRGDGIDIWVMKEYGVSESWTRQLQIPFRGLNGGRVADGFLYPRPLSFSADGRYILMNYINESSFWIYDSHSQEVLRQFNKKSIVGATTYVESLVSLALDHGEEEEERHVIN